MTIGSGAGQAINAGTATVRLNAAGTINEAAGSIITALSFGANTTAGNITLTGNNAVGPSNADGTFAAGDTAALGSISFTNATTGIPNVLTINTVSADPTSAALFPATTGVTTNTSSTNNTATVTTGTESCFP